MPACIEYNFGGCSAILKLQNMSEGYVCLCSAAAAEAPEDEERPPPVEFQPESVVGEMREYQLEGLKWLVARFDDGINTILADEMVRVRRDRQREDVSARFAYVHAVPEAHC